MALKLMRGNEVVAEGAIRAGCKFYTGYPITPQNELFEYMANRLPQVGGVFLQCESEVAGINMIWGAACTGTRAMTSSSGPGISLMSEGLTTLAAGQLPRRPRSSHWRISAAGGGNARHGFAGGLHRSGFHPRREVY